MGADVTLENVIDNGGEPTADIVVKTSKLKKNGDWWRSHSNIDR